MNILGLNLNPNFTSILPRGAGAAVLAVAGALADTRMNPVLPGRASNSELLKAAAIGADVFGIGGSDMTRNGQFVDGASAFGIGSLVENLAVNHLVTTTTAPPAKAPAARSAAAGGVPPANPTITSTSPGQGIPSAAGAQFEMATTGY